MSYLLFQSEYLRKKRQEIPRFLFRGWMNRSGRSKDTLLYSVNSPTEFIPHAFVKNPELPLREIWEIDREIVNGHFLGIIPREEQLLSQCSSWTHALNVASWAVSLGGEVRPGTHITMLDTTKLPEECKVYFGPDVQRAGLSDHPWPEEYLIHGCIRGDCIVSMRSQELVAAGGGLALQRVRGPFILPRTIPSHAKVNIPTQDLISEGKKFADLFVHPRPATGLEYTYLMLNWLAAHPDFDDFLIEQDSIHSNGFEKLSNELETRLMTNLDEDSWSLVRHLPEDLSDCPDVHRAARVSLTIMEMKRHDHVAVAMGSMRAFERLRRPEITFI